ncbi:AEC family transporter [uncultured Paracoccus sp.]|uniref:AEC family transporter n=1 Tax=uncultured Paracoccus sp. TaxID=189685 RepID=UPI00345A49DA
MLFTVVLPVFLVLGYGYLVAWLGWMSTQAIDGLMRFAQNFAVPVLLFQSIATMDLGAHFDPVLLSSFYVGAFASYAAGWAGARFLFGRSPEDAVAIGFVCLFSNTLLLGVPITQRAYGDAALAGNFAIVAIHSPLVYTFGITAMEFTRARGTGLAVSRVAWRALIGVFRTPMVLGILCGVAMNLAGMGGLVMPEGFWAAIAMVKGAALPTALFALGGVIWRYRPRGDAGVIAMCCAVSLLLHPTLTMAIGSLGGLDTASIRSAVVTAAMPPGVNAFLFASMYQSAQRVAASTVLISTLLSVLSSAMWLDLLP